jgi:hypothetical protein
MTRILIAVAGALVVGGLLASAFNPDSGTIAHVEGLWRVGGLMVYAAFATPFLLLIYLLLRALARAAARLACHRRRTRHAGRHTAG